MSEYDELLTALGSAVLCRGDECRDKSARSGCICTMAKNAIEELEAKLAKAVDVGIGVGASLAAAISLLERGGKRAAPSDKMFVQMLADYNASLDSFRAAIAEINGGGDT